MEIRGYADMNGEEKLVLCRCQRKSQAVTQWPGLAQALSEVFKLAGESSE
jgi:hypothetical protein